MVQTACLNAKGGVLIATVTPKMDGVMGSAQMTT